jgi:hypothetical protein
MFGYVFTITFLSCLTIILLIFSFLMMKSGDESWSFAAVPALVCGVIVAFMIYTYDERVTQNADEFFKTRSNAYSCELPDGYACKYRIKEWREDSVYWQTKVDKILKE